MKLNYILLVSILLFLTGCTTVPDGTRDVQSTLGHLLVPGYSTWDNIRDKRDDLMAQNIGEYSVQTHGATPLSNEDFQHYGASPASYGISVPDVWSAVGDGDWTTVLAVVWDGVKAGAWAGAVDAASGSSSNKKEPPSGGVTPIPGCTQVLVDGKKNKVDFPNEAFSGDCTSLTVRGEENEVDSRSFRSD